MTRSPRSSRFTLGAALLALLLAPAAANAASGFGAGTIGCSGALSSSITDGALMDCSGNLVLDGGNIFSDTLIRITSSGSMNLDHLTFNAPLIEFVAQGDISFGSFSSVSGNDIFITSVAGTISLAGSVSSDGTLFPVTPPILTIGTGTVAPGAGIITPVGAVPEPGAWLTMLAGLLALLGAQAWRARRAAGGRLR